MEYQVWKVYSDGMAYGKISHSFCRYYMRSRFNIDQVVNLAGALLELTTDLATLDRVPEVLAHSLNFGPLVFALVDIRKPDKLVILALAVHGTPILSEMAADDQLRQEILTLCQPHDPSAPTLQDHLVSPVLDSLAPKYILYKNTIFSLLKLGLVFLFVFLGAYGIFLSWTISAFIALLFSCIVLIVRYRHKFRAVIYRVKPQYFTAFFCILKPEIKALKC